MYRRQIKGTDLDTHEKTRIHHPELGPSAQRNGVANQDFESQVEGFFNSDYLPTSPSFYSDLRREGQSVFQRVMKAWRMVHYG